MLLLIINMHEITSCYAQLKVKSHNVRQFLTNSTGLFYDLLLNIKKANSDSARLKGHRSITFGDWERFDLLRF